MKNVLTLTGIKRGWLLRSKDFKENRKKADTRGGYQPQSRDKVFKEEALPTPALRARSEFQKAWPRLKE